MSVLALIDAVDPDRIAVICGDDRITYGQLRAKSHALAGVLRARGVQPEEIVGVAAEPSAWSPIAMLGVLCAGAAYLPLDPSYPRARLDDMLAQAGGPLVLSTTRSAHAIAARDVLLLDEPWSEAAPAPTLVHDPRSLAYVIFTSGSTGRPKGVMATHGGLANLVRAQIETFAIDPDSVVLQFAPLSFDASVSEVFTALAAGATLCLAPRDELAPGPALVALVQRHGVSVVTLPPSSLALLDPQTLPSLRTVVSAGEACSAELVARWAPGRRFVNAYGPTEITVCATMGVCEAGGTPCIGAPLPNTTVAVLDEALQPVEPGGIGELYVGGVGVTRGYLRAPALTAERFVPGPGGARLYRTGDLVRLHDERSLEFIGRADHQVKIRGHRIELGEVEAVIRSVPAVRDTVVIARDQAADDRRLVAYVIGDVDPDALRAVLEAKLPAFARPTDIVVVTEWPRSPAGKIDRARLPAPPPRVTTSAPARSATELRLAQIWQAVLGVPRVGPDDDFFALGGHSLLAIRMLGRVREELGVEIPLSFVAQRRTLAALASAVAARGANVQLASPLLLRTAKERRTLYLVPPVSGSALAYLPLLGRLRADRTVRAFHAPGFDGRPTPDQFERLAAHFIEELRAIEPPGPVLLAGWSIGGALAIEMALQLSDLGYDVPNLLLFDTNAPNPYLAEGIKDRFGALTPSTFAWMYTNNFARCFGVDLGLDKAAFAALPEAELAPRALAELRRVPAFPPDMDVERMKPHLATFAAIGGGFVRWRPARRYRGRIVMFLAAAGHPEFNENRYDWSEFVEHPVTTFEVPGNHFSLVNEPHVAVLARELDRVLDELP